MAQPDGGRAARSRGEPIRVVTSVPARAVARADTTGRPPTQQGRRGATLRELGRQLPRRAGGDSDEEFDTLVEQSRHRFQKLLAEGVVQDGQLSAQMTSSRRADDAHLAGASPLAFGDSRSALFKDSPSLLDRVRSPFKDSPFGERPSLLCGTSSLLGERSLLSGRLRGQLATSPAGSASPATLDRTGVQTFQSSSTTSSSSTTVKSGGGREMVTRVHRQHQSDLTTRDGAAKVEQVRARRLETATVTSQNGRTHVDAHRIQLAQKSMAETRSDGTTEVSQTVAASAAARRRVLQRTNSGSNRQVSLSGEDFSAQASIGLELSATGQVTSEVGGQVSPLGGCQTSGPLWRFFDAGPLIQPPGVRIKGRIQIKASHSTFSVRDGQLPRFTGDQFAFEDTFGGSESESDDDELAWPTACCRQLGSSAAGSPALERQKLPWRNKPALQWANSSKTASSPPSEAPPSRVQALSWRPTGRPASQAPSEAPSEASLDSSGLLIPEFSDATEKEDACQRRLYKIASELLTSERTYVQELHLIDQIFRVQVETENTQHQMFDNDVTDQIFSNVRSIYQFHKEHLLPKLEERLRKWEEDPRVGDILKSSAPFLKMYAEYVSNFSTAMNLMSVHYTKCARFAAIVNRIHGMPECANLPLQHHMITPVQRVPRYRLLLEDYLSRLGDQSSDRVDTEHALQLVSMAAQHSNDTIKKMDKFKHLLEIQESIRGGPDLVSPTRELVKDGNICKISAASGDHQDRYLFLFSDLLLLCSRSAINKRITSAPAYRLRAKFTIEGMQVFEGDNLETLNTFYVCGNQKNVELYAPTADQKAEWLEALCAVVTAFYQRKASLKGDAVGEKQLGGTPPVGTDANGGQCCAACGAIFSVMRRKRTCRACSQVVCSKCSGQKVTLPGEGDWAVRVCDKCHKQLTDGGGAAGQALRRQNVLDAVYTRGSGVLQMAASEPALRNGDLLFRCRRAWVKRRFCLRANHVLYMYASGDAQAALAATPVPGFTVTWAGAGKSEQSVSDKERERTFKLTLGRRSYVFIAGSKEDTARWIAALQRASRTEALPEALPETSTAVGQSAKLSSLIHAPGERKKTSV